MLKRKLESMVKRRRFPAALLLLACASVHGRCKRNALVANALSTNNPPNRRGTCIVAGASGYIGKAVVREAVRQGYHCVALVRNVAKIQADPAYYGEFLQGAQLVECDVTNPAQIDQVFRRIAVASADDGITSVISCLAARSGTRSDAFAIDYHATKHCFNAAIANRARHFTLLSAFCVAKPELAFQEAKLKLEAEMQRPHLSANEYRIDYSIVRPTAFFKSVSGQLRVVQSGAPFMMFNRGRTRSNPISERDLAEFLVDCVRDHRRRNRILNVGGPDGVLTRQEQGEMLFRAIGQRPNYMYIPAGIFDVIVNAFQFAGDLLGNQKLLDAAEQTRIGRYYATEDMLTTKPDEIYGRDHLEDYFVQIATEGQASADDVNTQTLIRDILFDLLPQSMRRAVRQFGKIVAGTMLVNSRPSLQPARALLASSVGSGAGNSTLP